MCQEIQRTIVMKGQYEYTEYFEIFYVHVFLNKFSWQVYLLVCTVDKFSLTSFVACLQARREGGGR
jgi:hypothetical protein